MDRGGELEAAVRALVYIAEGQRFVDARSFEILRRISKAYPDITFAHYKAVVREEWAKLVLDERGRFGGPAATSAGGCRPAIGFVRKDQGHRRGRRRP